MNVLRVKAYQETVCYRKPFTNKVTETYPLPPYSTVKGMIHALLNADTLIPFSLSIQGQYESQIIDYKKNYLIKKRQFAMPIILDGLRGKIPMFDKETMSSMPLYTHLLYNVHLVIHINAEKAILDAIYEAFMKANTFLSLGRYEDLLRIDEIKYVPIKETDHCRLQHSIYVPEKYVDKDFRGIGIPYLLNWTYEVKRGIREWKRIPVLYVSQDRTLQVDELVTESFLIDDENFPVFWNE